VVHLGVAEQFFKTAESRRPRVVENKYFLSVTTHPRRKNVLGALQAFATFAAKSDAQYVVAGLMGEIQRQEFLALADQLGVRDKVLLFGYADDPQLVSLYQNAEFTLYPSFYEGFGLPVVEAMACGCPVIASNTSSLPEIVPNAEWLVNPYDLGEIADKMQRMSRLSTDDRRQIGENNRRYAQNFTWEKTARQMIEIFEQLGRKPSNINH
jgi:glycosyltransferase involved in cell wall biosynthesis